MKKKNKYLKKNLFRRNLIFFKNFNFFFFFNSTSFYIFLLNKHFFLQIQKLFNFESNLFKNTNYKELFSKMLFFYIYNLYRFLTFLIILLK